MTVFLSLSILTIGWFIYSENKSDELLITASKNQLDSDKDGIVDSKDNCPDVAGAINMFGCPDIDGDGLSDNEEIEKGTDPHKVDTDGDGENDKSDQCPLEKGTKENNGCKAKEEVVVPIPPVDNDINSLVSISYKGKKYTIKKGITTKEGLTFNKSGWRYYKNKWENEEPMGTGKWKSASHKDIDFILSKYAKEVVVKKPIDEKGQDKKTDNSKKDTDGDGLMDSEESTNGTNPNKKDTDGDGVNDKKDKCPLEKGTKVKGCPDVKISNEISREDWIRLRELYYKLSYNSTISNEEKNNWNMLYNQLYSGKKTDLTIESWDKTIRNILIKSEQHKITIEDKERLRDLYQEIASNTAISKDDLLRWKKMYNNFYEGNVRDKQIESWNQYIRSLVIE